MSDQESIPEGLQEAEDLIVDDLAQLVAERDELRSIAQQLQADFENYKKRMLREQTAIVERASERLLVELLPAFDSFELATASLEAADDTDVEQLRKGVALAVGQLREVVERAGLEPIVALGAGFDPELHEAVMQDDGSGEPVVDQVLRTGYRLKGRVVRPAMVKVTRVPKQDEVVEQ